MIHEQRICSLNNNPVNEKGRYVLYWMQASQRSEYNHALEYAVRQANQYKKPAVVYFGITDSYPHANLRHYDFMLHGLCETNHALSKRGIQMVVQKKSPEKGVVDIAKDACLVVTDFGPTRIQRQWRKYAAEQILCDLLEVETDTIVPLEVATEKENFSAGTIRPRISKHLDTYLVSLKRSKPKRSSLNMEFQSLDISDVIGILKKLNIDQSVPAVTHIKSGTTEAKKRLKAFIKNKLDKYDQLRNDPSLDYMSNMSPYLHFGQISPLYIALEVMKTNSPGKDSYLEELIVRRELAWNFVYYNPSYDTIQSLPPWARTTLDYHKKDKREYVYSLNDFEQANTHDPYWNAAQKEMVITGKMHGYMRMYWGKKILEWSKTPETAYKTAVYLNDKYELDGRDPNGYAGVAWCFGKHDRAWGQRPITGKVRYMAPSGLKRKFDIDRYVEQVESLIQ